VSGIFPDGGLGYAPITALNPQGDPRVARALQNQAAAVSPPPDGKVPDQAPPASDDSGKIFGIPKWLLGVGLVAGAAYAATRKR